MMRNLRKVDSQKMERGSWILTSLIRVIQLFILRLLLRTTNKHLILEVQSLLGVSSSLEPQKKHFAILKIHNLKELLTFQVFSSSQFSIV